MATVAELIAFLQKQDQETQVAYQLFSEQCILDISDIQIAELSKPRTDGWVHDKRHDVETQMYVLFPGN